MLVQTKKEKIETSVVFVFSGFFGPALWMRKRRVLSEQ